VTLDKLIRGEQHIVYMAVLPQGEARIQRELDGVLAAGVPKHEIQVDGCVFLNKHIGFFAVPKRLRRADKDIVCVCAEGSDDWSLLTTLALAVGRGSVKCEEI
jgi:hypothetical protein